MATAGAYRGTLLSARKPKLTLSLAAVRARTLGIVVPHCTGCGTLEVYLAGHRIGSITTATSKNAARQVVWLSDPGAVLTGTLLIKTTSGKPVYVDGIVSR